MLITNDVPTYLLRRVDHVKNGFVSKYIVMFFGKGYLGVKILADEEVLDECMRDYAC